MKKLILIFCLIIGFIGQLQAQDEWLHYTLKDDIMGIEIYNDEIWMATIGGVMVMDINGEIISEYTEVDGLIYNRVTSISIDLDGVKWFGTAKGVSSFDGVTWKSYNNESSGLIYNVINSITVDSLNNKWFATPIGVSKYDGESWEYFRTSNSGLISNDVCTIAIDLHGDKWFGTVDGVSKFDDVNWISYTSLNSGLISENISSIAIDSSGNKWIGTSAGIARFDDNSWEIINQLSGLASDLVDNVKVDSENNIWVFYRNCEITKFDGEKWKTQTILYTKDNGVRSIEIDSKGRKWFNTIDGIIMDNDTSRVTYQYPGILGASSVAVDLVGDKWFGSWRGVSKFDDNSWNTFTISNSGLVSSWVNTVAVDLDGIKWFGTDKGVSKFDDKSWETVFDEEVTSIVIDSANNKWFIYYRGVVKFDGYSMTYYNATNSGLIDNKILSMAIDINGDKWFTTPKGVSKFDGETWVSYTSSNSGLIRDYVYSLAIDLQGNKWFGTWEGVSMFNGNDWISYTSTPTGLNIQNVKYIAINSKGEKLFFLDVNNELIKFDGYNWEHVYKSFISDYAIDLSGNEWFATGGGALVLLNQNSKNSERTFKMTGSIYFDKNKNHLLDNGEGYVKGQKVILTPGNITAYSNENGEYVFQADSGINYSITFVPIMNYSLTKDTSYSVMFENKDVEIPLFGVYAPDTIIYQSSISTIGSGRCNTEVPMWFTYSNKGTLANNVKAQLTLDVDVEVLSSFPNYDSLVGNTLFYTFSDFPSGTSRQIKLNVLNPTFERMGDTLLYSSKLIAEGKEFIEIESSVVTCSYDPNDKAVSPLPVGEEYYTLKNEVLKYTIRFQNTGNDTAFYVAIKDTLSTHLDLTTFEVLGSSHIENTTMDSLGVVSFEFRNIVLPDSATNEKESNGFVSYSIKAKKDVEENTKVTNTAHILFDQNPAIVTNTTLNNLVSVIPSGVVGFEDDGGVYKVSLFPNPLSVSSILKFENATSKEAELLVQDVSGKTVFSKRSSGEEFELNRSDFNANGIYFYSIKTESKLISGKLLVD